MTDLSHWVFTDKFTGHQAAFLILGIDPSTNTDGSSAEHIRERIKAAYEGALKNLRFQVFVEPSLPDSWFDDHDTAPETVDPKTTLMSLEIERRLASFKEGNKLGIISWLESGRNELYEQMFSRQELARWISENNFPSKYQFANTAKIQSIDKTKKQMEKPLSSRERETLLNIIGVMLELLQSHKPGRSSDAAIIKEMIDNYGEKPGIKKRTLEEKFPAAKRSLAAE